MSNEMPTGIRSAGALADGQVAPTPRAGIVVAGKTAVRPTAVSLVFRTPAERAARRAARQAARAALGEKATAAEVKAHIEASNASAARDRARAAQADADRQRDAIAAAHTKAAAEVKRAETVPAPTHVVTEHKPVPHAEAPTKKHSTLPPPIATRADEVAPVKQSKRPKA